MKIWLINNYVTLPKYGHFCRQYYFGVHLKDMGHEPVVFAGSHPHNSRAQLIGDRRRFMPSGESPFPWIYVKTLNYEGSRLKQILSMFQFYFNGRKAAKWAAERYGKPDAVLGSSAHPLAALLAVRLARKYGCRSAVEIRDLWPESIVAYGVAGPRNPAVLALRRLEKWLYRHADAVVFTMEGAYDYIVERGWERDIPRSKVFYVNNGVDLERFDADRERFRLEDPDLEDPDAFKLVYTGSVRMINGLSQLMGCAERLRNHADIRFLVYGGGDDVEELMRLCREKGLTNLVFKGPVEKKYVPGILSRCDAALLNYRPETVKLYRFGNSQNKLFEYLAAGKPVLTNVKIAYNPADRRPCCFASASPDAEDYAEAVLKLYRMPGAEYEAACRNARRIAEEYDYQELTKRLLQALEGPPGSGENG